MKFHITWSVLSGAIGGDDAEEIVESTAAGELDRGDLIPYLDTYDVAAAVFPSLPEVPPPIAPALAARAEELLDIPDMWPGGLL